MNLPSPRARLADCVWLPRIIAKARLIATGELPPDYVARFGHPGGVDGQFLAFFALAATDIAAAAVHADEQVAAWFTLRPEGAPGRIAEWNHLAENLGRPGFPMAERLPIALSTTYKHLAGAGLASVFEVLEADER